AVRAEETSGASVYAPAAFRCMGRSRPGRACDLEVGSFQAVEVATGAPMPRGADAVVPVEITRCESDWVYVIESIPQGRNISRRGEDLAPGRPLLPAGRRLRPQDLGLLSAAGIGSVRVVRRPRVAVIVTGNELLPPGTPARDFQIPDSNSVMIGALIERD